MSDDWEDWENDDFTIPVLNIPNEEQLKQIKERKLVEESDNVLSKELFSNGIDNEYKILNSAATIEKQTQFTEKKALSKKISNKELNELKQKEFSKKIKEIKKNKQKAKETFGEIDDYDEYADYEDMFY